MTPAWLGARRRYEPVEGAPFQPGERVRVVAAVDQEVLDLSELVGAVGVVAYLEYDCGSGQTFPGDPMIGVHLDGGVEQEFWPEELQGDAARSAAERTGTRTIDPGQGET